MQPIHPNIPGTDPYIRICGGCSLCTPTPTLGGEQPEYFPIPAVVFGWGGRVTTRWTFTLEERKLIAEGKDLYLSLLTFGLPMQPIQLAVGEEELLANW